MTFYVRTKVNKLIHSLVHEKETSSRIDSFLIFRENRREENITCPYQAPHLDSIVTGAYETYRCRDHESTSSELITQALVLTESTQKWCSWASLIYECSCYGRTEVPRISYSITIAIWSSSTYEIISWESRTENTREICHMQFWATMIGNSSLHEYTEVQSIFYPIAIWVTHRYFSKYLNIMELELRISEYRYIDNSEKQNGDREEGDENPIHTWEYRKISPKCNMLSTRDMSSALL